MAPAALSFVEAYVALILVMSAFMVGLVLLFPDGRAAMLMVWLRTMGRDVSTVDRFMCPECRQNNNVNAPFCASCGVAFHIDQIPPHDAASASAQSLDALAVFAAQTESVPGKIRGQVFDIESGWGRMDIWIERHYFAGRRLPDVLVEMRGWNFEGTINYGDWVEVSSNCTPLETLRTRELLNLTTGLAVKARGSERSRLLIFVLVFIILAAFFLAAPTDLNPSGGSRPGEPIPGLGP
ncbi:MAG: hypothetical protein PVSMB7_22950 [Chloroflexota bacterium]